MLQLIAETIIPTGQQFDGLDRKTMLTIQRTQNLFAGQVFNRARRYPPERAGQKYRRTMTLRDSWHITPSHQVGDSREVAIYNDATDPWGRQYAGFVYGFNLQGRGQSIWHVGRWPTQGELLNEQSYATQIQNAINKVFGA